MKSDYRRGIEVGILIALFTVLTAIGCVRMFIYYGYDAIVSAVIAGIMIIGFLVSISREG